MNISLLELETLKKHTVQGRIEEICRLRDIGMDEVTGVRQYGPREIVFAWWESVLSALFVVKNSSNEYTLVLFCIWSSRTP